MTSYYGTGKNWGSIKKKLEGIHLSADDPEEIKTLLGNCQAEYEQQIKQVRQKLKNEISQLRQEILQEEEQARSNLAAVSEDNSLAIEQSKAALDFIKQDHGIFSPLRNFFRSRRETEKISNLKTSLQTKNTEIEQPLQNKKREMERKKSQIDDLSRQECQEVLNKIDVLRGILGSPEMAGASAENDLLASLSRLSGNIHVLNNVTIKVDKGILFEGLLINQAQIDALVLTPTGLFAIGIKNWTKQPEEKETADPYSQIKRAAQLCYEMIKTEFPGVTVRSVLAYRGRPPESQNPGIVKVLPLPDVAAYVDWFKDNTLSERTLQMLLDKLNKTQTAGLAE